MSQRFDLGDGSSYEFTSWRPDRKLNPQHANQPDVAPCGVIIHHADGCTSSLMFDHPVIREVMPGRDLWQVQALDPLTISPSVLRRGDKNNTNHNHHGWIQHGRWVPAGDDLSPA